MSPRAQAARAARKAQPKPIPNKLYFPIREVAALTGVAPYVLRFWEKEFPMLSPAKERSGHRRYRRKDIELVLEIKRLLYDQGFTIPGARTRLQKNALPLFPSIVAEGKQSKSAGNSSPSAVLRSLRRELKEILNLLDQS
jgi:DNA-binding transcriptional MerR regulator